ATWPMLRGSSRTTAATSSTTSAGSRPRSSPAGRARSRTCLASSGADGLAAGRGDRRHQQPLHPTAEFRLGDALELVEDRLPPGFGQPRVVGERGVQLARPSPIELERPMDGLVLDVLEAETPELLGSSDVIERMQDSARVELMDGNSTGAK